jgi:SAM-dependent methyltransferase
MKNESSPAQQSYAQQQRFHRASLRNRLGAGLARMLPRELRQRLRLRRRLELVVQFSFDGVDLVLGRRKELVPPRHLNFVGHGDFIAIGDEFMRYFVDLGGLTPEGKVLEIGSGIGRMARPLTNYLTSGTYDGIDIVPKGIRWCQKNITPPFPNFTFHLADIHNLAYNPSGHLKALEYRFPFAENTFDLVALTSVFSHMLTAEMEHYLSETARCLRSNGTALITFFLLNDQSKDFIEKGKSALTFRYSRDGCRVNDGLVPEYAVAYDEARIRQLCARTGFTIESLNYGVWCGRPEYLSYQDILVVRKTA